MLKAQKLAKKQWRRGVHDNRRRLLDIQSRHPGGFFKRPKHGTFLRRDRQLHGSFEG